MLIHVLDPLFIDDYGYRNMRVLLESTGALDPDYKAMTKREVPDTAETPELTQAESENGDWSDFEDEDGNQTALPPGTTETDDEESTNSSDPSDAGLNAQHQQ
ncbi:hypothetical protein PC111_g20323 [Phytophthora cactorum]|uniref:Uncharacterized protein n=1 Tax=Phytophthora cactorum TaxID=29920 RepID=A0A8T1AQF5_9STRA|nr:hypothetical protein PC112_g20844 [Phytophthora cactorum]KAG2799683.1 hypothetical protein PC111_g20323 [Phytophthora cactorum]KAG2886725.1 hypothetical protein PC115_g20588 [Phytophthora cactorum]KAG2897279.1 hypothetical protein PC117_g22820 [Phytophthora cactorum]KAG3081542.1 hypothetical protein PC122_g11289 [Phytophthora cactorum]